MGRFGRDKTQTWLTDSRLLAWVGPIDTDPATRADNPTCATHFYTEADDGLSKPWHGFVYCNPPYDKIGPWVDRALSHDGECVMLLPSRTTAQWLHTAVRAGAELFFFRKRLKFVPDYGVLAAGNVTAPFDSMLLCNYLGATRMRSRADLAMEGVWL